MKNRNSILHTGRRPLRSAFIVAGTHNEVGKTTVTLGLMTAVEGFLNQKFIRRLPRWIENHIDLDHWLKKTRTVIEPRKIRKNNRQTRKRPITNCVANYAHLHFGFIPTMVEGWVEAIRNRVHK